MRGDIDGTGNALKNVITGSAGNNVLDGGAGADILIGGFGDDTYKLGYDTTDQVIDSAGNDAILTYVSRDLRKFQTIECIVLERDYESLVSEDTYLLQGNSLNNFIESHMSGTDMYGFDGNDTLRGFGFQITMYGGSGDDQYSMQRDDATIVEELNEGWDSVFVFSEYYVLGENLESLSISHGEFTGVGNSADNEIFGFAGIANLFGCAGNDRIFGHFMNDKLDGGSGADSLFGGDGDDTYFVDNANDYVGEYSDAGTDTVHTTVDFSLSDEIENLVLVSGDINGTGNALDNSIIGSDGNNIINGGAGADILNGGAGTDLITGGSGADVFVTGQDDGIDSVDEMTDFVYGEDLLQIEMGDYAIGNGDDIIDNAIVISNGMEVLASNELIICADPVIGSFQSGMHLDWLALMNGVASLGYEIGTTQIYVFSNDQNQTAIARYTHDGWMDEDDFAFFAYLNTTGTASLSDFNFLV